MSISFYIGTYFPVEYLAIKYLLGTIILVSIGNLHFQLISMILCQFHTGVDPMDQYHLPPQNKNILLKY